MPQLARYIKKKKPNIDIHLLGCTEIELLRQCRFATSCDSTTYVSQKRYGFYNGKWHISKINTDKVRKLVGDSIYNTILEYNKEQNTNYLCLQIYDLMLQYEAACGSQDYKPYLPKFQTTSTITPTENEQD